MIACGHRMRCGLDISLTIHATQLTGTVVDGRVSSVCTVCMRMHSRAGGSLALSRLQANSTSASAPICSNGEDATQCAVTMCTGYPREASTECLPHLARACARAIRSGDPVEL